MAEATIAAVVTRQSVVVGSLTGMAYAIGKQEMRQRVLGVTRDTYAFGEDWLRSPEQLQRGMIGTLHCTHRAGYRVQSRI